MQLNWSWIQRELTLADSSVELSIQTQRDDYRSLSIALDGLVINIFSVVSVFVYLECSLNCQQSLNTVPPR